jgi:hypothetical protein
MPDVRQLLQRQADWQRSQRRLSWPEKVRWVEAVHGAIRQFRDMRAGREGAPAAKTEGDPGPRTPDGPPQGDRQR